MGRHLLIVISFCFKASFPRFTSVPPMVVRWAAGTLCGVAALCSWRRSPPPPPRPPLCVNFSPGISHPGLKLLSPPPMFLRSLSSSRDRRGANVRASPFFPSDFFPRMTDSHVEFERFLLFTPSFRVASHGLKLSRLRALFTQFRFFPVSQPLKVVPESTTSLRGSPDCTPRSLSASGRSSPCVLSRFFYGGLVFSWLNWI